VPEKSNNSFTEMYSIKYQIINRLKKVDLEAYWSGEKSRDLKIYTESYNDV